MRSRTPEEPSKEERHLGRHRAAAAFGPRRHAGMVPLNTHSAKAPPAVTTASTKAVALVRAKLDRVVSRAWQR
jgi:hypothetical protein